MSGKSMLSKALRSRQMIVANQTILNGVRGGGGHFHRPDPKLGSPYEQTRVVQLEDINTTLYHDFSPEYHMHMHSAWIQNAKQGHALLFCYFLLILAPCWAMGAYLHKKAGSQLTPALRPGPDHEHMGPRLIKHMKEHNFESTQDALGRRTGTFYKNFCRQSMEYEMKPSVLMGIEAHGFKF